MVEYRERKTNMWTILLILTSFLTKELEAEKGCNKVIRKNRGQIVSPREPGSTKYKNNLSCSWKIIVPRGSYITLNTKSFHLEDNFNCETDALYVYDGPDEKSPLHGRPYCGLKGPKKINSSTNYLYLKMITDKTRNYGGFVLEFEAVKECDFVFRMQQNGTFHSPNFPYHYKENANCSYRIIVKPKSSVELRFHDFYLETKVRDKCLDYVAVYDVISGNEKLIKKMCGIGIPAPITSASNIVLVKFYSDDLVSSRGFNATFNTVYHHCASNEFKCYNGRCVHLSLICNTVNDCYDNSDEVHCKCERYLCKNSNCISETNVCDGIDHCGDFSDELRCSGGIQRPEDKVSTITAVPTTTKTTSTTSTAPPIKTQLCPYGEFMCTNTKCVDPTQRCDGTDDCGDNSDESDCSGQCRNKNGGCQHICTDDKVTGVKCSCYNGFILDSDKYSCIDIDECSSGPCTEMCINIYGSYRCECRKGYRLAADGFNCTDIDECELYKELCEQRCINTVGSYRCSCFPGYTYRSEKQACVDIDECALDGGDCAEKCVNTLGSYRCECEKKGYSKIPGKTHCEEINECELGIDSCSQDCVNTDGSYKCKCRPGFRLDYNMHTCVDIDECLEGNTPGCWGNCVNTLGSYRCECDIGFRGIMNDTRCEDIDECKKENGGCSNICINTRGSFRCKCPLGFIARDPNSFTCYDENECEQNPCTGKGRCVNHPGAFACVCNKGFRLANKTHCVDIDECRENNNGGCSESCTNTDGSYFCSCGDGFHLDDNDKTLCIKEADGAGCRRIKINTSAILDSEWTDVKDGWAWQAGISVNFHNYSLNLPRVKCMGILIHTEFVITTSHCLRFWYIPIEPSKILLSLGSYKYGYQNARKNVRAKAIFFQEKQNLALIHLSQPVKSKYIKPLCLPEKGHVNTATGQQLITAMWPNQGFSRNLQHIKTTIDTIGKCKWNGKYVFSSKDSICVKFNVPETMRLLPPSGAPLLGMLRGTSPLLRKQKWYLTGLLVHGDGYPGERKTKSPIYHHVGFRKVSVLYEWIQKTIERGKNQ